MLDLAEQDLAASRAATPDRVAACFHCGEPCPDDRYSRGDRLFCCRGCLLVHDLLADNGLSQFYELGQHPGVRMRRQTRNDQWAYLDEPALQERLLDFTNGKTSRVTFQIPAIHCIACVWLLENLFRLHSGVGRARVNFPRREVALSFAPEKIRLSELVSLLSSLGYEPQLTLGELEKTGPTQERKRRWLQVGIAGFAFGNIMLFSLPSYLGLEAFGTSLFKTLFGFASLALAFPVLVFSASDYWRSAWLSLRQRVLTLDVPIALGLAALYAQSAYEIIFARGGGYLDSLSGLVLFLLCGRMFQQKTHERLAFDRDYKCFFPLSVMRKTGTTEETVAISNLKVGDHLLLRHGELLPADARLVSGAALLDYSFVTGESEPVPKSAGDYLYAGGRQMSGAIEVETVKPVSQSYLTSLWNNETFQKSRENSLDTLTNRYSRRFTRLVIGLAVLAALYWLSMGDSVRALKAFTSVLIVACPCALALAAPFTLGTAQRWLARARVFVKNSLVLERMARIDSIVFDKTGTLTTAQASSTRFHAAPKGIALGGPELSLSGSDEAWIHWVRTLARHSTHPYSARIADCLGPIEVDSAQAVVENFQETPGFGIVGRIHGHEIRLGSRAWLEGAGVLVPALTSPAGSQVFVSVARVFHGVFVVTHALQPEVDRALEELRRRHEIALLSGDNDKQRQRFGVLFNTQRGLHFDQSPLDKLTFIRRQQDSGKRVMMVGDGLNDAGALKQSDVGVAVVEHMGAFSPASDVILQAADIARLPKILSFARRATNIVQLSFGISALYNLVGISIASAGILSPMICAVLMPVSSISVVLFACGMTTWAARQEGLIKSEIRIPKSEGNPKSEARKIESLDIGRSFRFPSDFDLRRPSDFVLSSDLGLRSSDFK